MKVYEYNTRLNAERLPILAESMPIMADGRKRYANSAQDAAELINSIIGDYAEEHAITLFFDNQLKLIGFATIGTGTQTASILDVRGMFQKALFMGAAKVMMAHNHPSGNTNPSPQDDAITEKAKQAGNLLDIALIGHIIVNGTQYYSYAANGKI